MRHRTLLNLTLLMAQKLFFISEPNFFVFKNFSGERFPSLCNATPLPDLFTEAT